MYTKININLLEPCSKKEPTRVLLQKGEDTVRSLSRANSVIVYTDGSSDIDCNRGGADISITYPSGNDVKLKIPTGQIASNFTTELIVIKEALAYCRSHSLKDSIKEIVIFSDSKSALEAIHNRNTSITPEINTLLHLLNIRCTLQWIPAHVGIEGNECADALAKEARDDDQPRAVTCADANAVARRRIYNQHLSHSGLIVKTRFPADPRSQACAVG
nr:ribonuclease H-like [Parasteatoda tepidariorum]